MLFQYKREHTGVDGLVHNTINNDDFGFLFLISLRALFSSVWECLGAIDVEPPAALFLSYGKQTRYDHVVYAFVSIRHQKYTQVQQPHGTTAAVYWYNNVALYVFRVTAGLHSTMSKSMYRGPAVFIRSYDHYSCHLTKCVA